MTELKEDMRDFSSINIPVNQNLEIVSLCEMVKKVELLLQTEIEQSNTKVICQELPGYKCISSDMLLVFQNLIQNWMKYSLSENKLIEISLKNKGEMLYIYTKYNGIGIKKEHFSEIFSLFKRLHFKNEFEGTGLGLSLSKKII